MRSLLLRLAPRRWRETIEGDLEESAGRNLRYGLLRRAWILAHLLVIVVRLRWTDVTDRARARLRPPVGRWIAQGLQDARYGVRRWTARPGFTAAALSTIALGIGTTSALFSVVDAVLLKPLPYPAPERLVTINRTYPEWTKDPILSASWDRISLAWPEFFDLRQRSHTIEDLAVITTRTAIVDADGAQEFRVGVISASFLPLLGVKPVLGRSFDAEADVRDPGTLLIAHAVWKGRFGGDRGIVGRAIPVRGGTRVIAGVLPERFSWGSRLTPYQFWYPLSAIPENERADNNRNLDAIARLRPGVTLGEATDEMSVLLREKFRYKAVTAAMATPLMDRQLRRVRTPLLLLLGGAVLLLVIACSNVAGLLTSDAASRAREMGIRASLGATRFRVVRQLLAEGLLLAAAGSALGLLVAVWGVRALVTLAPSDMPRVDEITVGWRVVAAAAASATMTALLFAALPAVALRKDHAAGASRGSRTVTAPTAAAVLAAIEIALGVALLAGAGLFARSLHALERVDTGFDRSNLVTLRAGLPPSSVANDTRATRFFRDAREAIRVLPGVTDVAVSSNVAFSSGRASTTISVPSGSGAATPFEAQRRFVSPEYFRTLRIRIISGRLFDRTDSAAAPPVAVVSRAMERRLWPEGAVGHTFIYANAPHAVIGVVNDIRELALDAEPEATFYLSTEQRPAWSTMRIIVRTAGEPAALAGSIREALVRLDPEVPVEDVITMDTIVFRATDEERYRTVLMCVFAIAATALSAIGLYSTLARRVVDRRRQIGVRIALGARPAQVRQLFLREGLRVAGVGVALGVPLAIGLGHTASALLFGVSAGDGPTLAMVVLVVGLLTALATYLPSVRASRLDPVAALRTD
jgi:putative ABC transport system permease protein